MRRLGIISLLLGVLALIGQLFGLAIPTARWFFAASRELPWLNAGTAEKPFLWFGWLSVVVLTVGGVMFIVRSFSHEMVNPVLIRRMKRFREMKRGYYSFQILLFLLLLASLDQLIVGKRALAVQHEGKWLFPAFVDREFKNRDFGITKADPEAPANYRQLNRKFQEEKSGRVIMPLIPFDPTGDTLPPRSRALHEENGKYRAMGAKELYSGLGARMYDIAEGKVHLRYRFRDGKLDGPADGWTLEGDRVYSAEYAHGELVNERYDGSGTKEEFLRQPSSEMRVVYYHPAPPMPEQGNMLGTTSQGYDVLAYLYGGLQVNFKSALIYLPFIYGIGLVVGLLSGYFGGWFDLVLQRLIEVFSNIPFLFVVIIFSSMVPDRYKGLPVILLILIIFGWMGITSLMRTAAFKERERDYVSAARVMGAGPFHILFRHILPNTVAIIVTLVPFSMSGLIFSLTALDVVGFGLPPEYATWGRLLSDGLANLSAPWLVSSTFVVLVALLVLITFVGEAIRDAFDPKKYTYYR